MGDRAGLRGAQRACPPGPPIRAGAGAPAPHPLHGGPWGEGVPAGNAPPQSVVAAAAPAAPCLALSVPGRGRARRVRHRRVGGLEELGGLCAACKRSADFGRGMINPWLVRYDAEF